MDTCISHSREETEALGEAWGRSAPRRWLIGLGGELGAGKTQLVRGLARGMGCTSRVHSPTFALVNEYVGGRAPVFHLDLYRLNSPLEVENAGLSLYLAEPDGLVAVEWFEKWEPDAFDAWRTGKRNAALDALAISRGFPVRLVWMENVSETGRRILYEDFGA
jgi:tRNA threonylcarbamoyladenosine biosynthesis protein TsaE